MQPPQQQPMSLAKKNQGTFKLEANDAFHKRSKHTDVSQCFLKDTEKKDEINILHMPTQKMASDCFTEGLCGAKFTENGENYMVEET